MTREGERDVRTTGVGIVGAGIMGHAHVAALAEHPGAKVVATASRREQPARELANAAGASRVYTEYEDLVRDPEVEVVCVATPDHFHTDVVIAAAQAGKHVLVEKPFTTSLADADRAIAAIRQAGVTAMTLFNHRWVPAYAHAREQMASGQLGSPAVGYARKNDRIFVPTKMLRWASATTPAWFLSSHDIDLMCWFFDDQVEDVYATAVSQVLRSRGVDTPDAIQAQVRFRGGAVATFEACWTYPDSFPTMTDSFVEVIGSAGVMHLDRKAEQIEVATDQGFEYPRTALNMTVHGHRVGAVPNAIGHFIDCVLDGRSPLVTLESSRHVTAILEAIHQSIDTRQPVRVTP